MAAAAQSSSHGAIDLTTRPHSHGHSNRPSARSGQQPSGNGSSPQLSSMDDPFLPTASSSKRSPSETGLGTPHAKHASLRLGTVAGRALAESKTSPFCAKVPSKRCRRDDGASHPECYPPRGDRRSRARPPCGGKAAAAGSRSESGQVDLSEEEREDLSRYARLVYECTLCSQSRTSFATASGFLDHLETVHKETDSGKPECNDCCMAFLSHDDLHAHKPHCSQREPTPAPSDTKMADNTKTPDTSADPKEPPSTRTSSLEANGLMTVPKLYSYLSPPGRQASRSFAPPLPAEGNAAATLAKADEFKLCRKGGNISYYCTVCTSECSSGGRATHLSSKQHRDAVAERERAQEKADQHQQQRQQDQRAGDQHGGTSKSPGPTTHAPETSPSPLNLAVSPAVNLEPLYEHVRDGTPREGGDVRSRSTCPVAAERQDELRRGTPSCVGNGDESSQSSSCDSDRRSTMSPPGNGVGSSSRNRRKRRIPVAIRQSQADSCSVLDSVGGNFEDFPEEEEEEEGEESVFPLKTNVLSETATNDLSEGPFSHLKRGFHEDHWNFGLPHQGLASDASEDQHELKPHVRHGDPQGLVGNSSGVPEDFSDEGASCEQPWLEEDSKDESNCCSNTGTPSLMTTKEQVAFLKAHLPHYVEPREEGNCYRMVLLEKVAKRSGMPEINRWGGSCNKAVQELFPHVVKDRYGKDKQYYKGVSQIGGPVTHPEIKLGKRSGNFSGVRRILEEYLPAVLRSAEDGESSVRRDDVISVVRSLCVAKELNMEDARKNIKNVMARLFPDAKFERKTQHKISTIFGVAFTEEGGKILEAVKKASPEEMSGSVYSSPTSGSEETWESQSSEESAPITVLIGRGNSVFPDMEEFRTPVVNQGESC